jgi:hypothetical protein
MGDFVTNIVRMVNYKRKDLPVIKDTVRPYRLWNPQTGKQLAHRCFGYEERAQDKALIMARRELKTGQSIEVIDVRYGKLIGVYTRRVHFIDFHGGK